MFRRIGIAVQFDHENDEVLNPQLELLKENTDTIRVIRNANHITIPEKVADILTGTSGVTVVVTNPSRLHFIRCNNTRLDNVLMMLRAKVEYIQLSGLSTPTHFNKACLEYLTQPPSVTKRTLNLMLQTQDYMLLNPYLYKYVASCMVFKDRVTGIGIRSMGIVGKDIRRIRDEMDQHYELAGKRGDILVNNLSDTDISIWPYLLTNFESFK